MPSNTLHEKKLSLLVWHMDSHHYDRINRHITVYT